MVTVNHPYNGGKNSFAVNVMPLVTASEANTTWTHPLQYFVRWRNRSIWNSLGCRKRINQPANQWSTIELLVWQCADGKTRKNNLPPCSTNYSRHFFACSSSFKSFRSAHTAALQRNNMVGRFDKFASICKPYMSEKPSFSALLRKKKCIYWHLLFKCKLTKVLS